MKSQIFRNVFEDSDLLVIEKLQPFLSQRSDRGSTEGLYEFISRTLGFALFPVHRLDREVLGLMIFAKTRKAAEDLSRQFKERTVEKRYEAKVRGKVRDERGTLVHFLKKNPKTNHVTVYPRETPGAKRAELDYEVVERTNESTVLLIHLKTGRSHQIRAQLSKIGHPIIGDERYDRRSSRVDEIDATPIQLKSVMISVEHPTTHERVSWSLFS